MLERVPTLDDRYVYQAVVRRIVDGDTVIVDIDLGCGVWLKGERCRLSGINAPETRGDDKLAGFRATCHLDHILHQSRPVLIRTIKDAKEKYGRWLVEIWQDDQCINQRMIDDGYAIAYEGD